MPLGAAASIPRVLAPTASAAQAPNEQRYHDSSPPASTTATPLSPEFVARALLRGFDRHYQLFRAVSAEAKARFEAQDWQGQQRAQRERIAFYDQRVEENVAFLRESYDAAQLSAEFWQQIKLHFIGMLINHRQPELAETFFNSVTTQILHRTYFQNDFIFVRPAISTEYLEVSNGELPTYWAVYPQRDTLATALRELILGFGLKVPFAHLDRDVQRMVSVLSRHIDTQRLRANFQIRVLSSLFFRNKGAYAVGRLINGFQELPFAFALLFNSQGQIFIDALLYGEDDLLMLFSFARAYFMVDTEVPSAMVQFLCSMMPRKPRSEFYNALGLAKQGKTLFFRDYLAHITHSSDRFRIAPGIKGMVMLVFDLPSFPFVFKVIKDYYPPQKDTTREQIRGKYLLVKQHDRVGRMADTLEFSNVAFPYARFDPDLIAEIQKFAPSQLEISDRDGDGEIEVILQHVYIERRMIPLNIYLQEACAALQKKRRRHPRPPPNGDRRHRLWQRHQRLDCRQHLPWRYAVEEFWHHTSWQSGVLRLRRDRIHHRLQLSQSARPAQRRRRNVGRNLVQGRPARRLSRNLCALFAWPCDGARCIHEPPRRPARPWLLASA